MRKKMLFKKAVAGMSVLVMGTASVLPAAPALAAEVIQEGETGIQNTQPEMQGTESEVQGAELEAGGVEPEKQSTENTVLTKESIEANDYVLYTVNCGTPDPTVVPNQDSERMGLLQSKVDQEYGTDEETGTVWGCDPETEFSKAMPSGDDATDIGNSFIYMSSQVQFDKYKSGLGYSFEVPTEEIEGIEKDTYEVTVAFKHWWENRTVNISLEGQTVATDVDLNYGEWVSKTFTTTVTDGELNVEVKAPRRTGTGGDPVLNFIKVRAVEDTDPEVTTYSSFTGTAGEQMYDTDGNLIQAHGGQIQQLTVDGVTKYYWIGEDKTNDYRPVGGIHMYSSTDLYNWDDEGVVLKTMEDPAQFENDEYFSSLYGDLTEEEKEDIFIDLDKNNCVMERPKMLYNDKTGKYVIWFHADGRIPGSDADYGKAKAGVAIGDSPTGPFKLLGSYKLHHAGDNYGYDGSENIGSVRDMNLFKDDDGTAYVIYSSEGNQTTYISKLNEEYTNLATPQGEAVEGVDFTRNFAGWSREAPAMFKYRNKYYIVNSGCTGWSPNKADSAVADSPLGPWTSLGDPCPDWGNGTTYDTQSTCVFPVDAANGKFIYMGDRWNAGYLRDSRYVWLPVEFQEEGGFKLRRYENWTLEDLEGKGLPPEIEVAEGELPETVASAADLPGTVTVTIDGSTQETPVEWDTSSIEEGMIGTITVTGTLTELGRNITHKLYIVNQDTRYFFDCNTEDSEYFSAAKRQLKDSLLNSVSEQKYTEETKAGYLGTTDKEDSENYDMGSHDGNDMWETGWWADYGKNIEYAFDVEPGEYTIVAGFQEWWDTTRKMKLTVSMEGTDAAVQASSAEVQILAEQEFTLDSAEKALQVNQKFVAAEEGTVKVSISKTSGADPVMSWIGLMGEETEDPAPAEKTDTISLNLAVAMAEKMEAEQETNKCYTEESWAAVQEALDAAKALLEKSDTVQEEIDNAFISLITACNKVENGTQKVGLKAAIEGTEAILADTESLSQYTEESVTAVREALAAAKNVFENSAADQGTINIATTSLLTAVTSLLIKEGDTRLDVLIQAAEALLSKEDQYTPASVQNLRDALDAAKAAAANSQATEEELQKAYDDLAKAMTELVRKANKDELKNTLEKANEILNESGKYLESSLEGLKGVTDEAQEVYDNQNATQEEIGEILKKLIAEILEVRLMGDVNLNGVVDSQDATEVLKYSVELNELTEEQLQVADVNGDAAADCNDAAEILKYSAELIDSFR